jgi:hypothetical protein
MTFRAPRRPSDLAGVPQSRRRAVRPLRRVAAAHTAPVGLADPRAPRRCLTRVKSCPGARDRARRRSPPPHVVGHRSLPSPATAQRSHAFSATGTRSSGPDLNPPPRRLRTTRAVGSRSDASRHPRLLQAAAAVRSGSNGSGSSQLESASQTPAGPGSFAENPPSFLKFTDIPFHLRKFLYSLVLFLCFSPVSFQTFTD